MRTRNPFVCAVLGAFIAGLGMFAVAQDPKFEKIADVMDKAHKSKLHIKVADGKASDDEEKLLIIGYEFLAKQKPPKGDQKSWDEKTKALVDAAKEAAKDDKVGGPKLKKAADCAACHKVHKG
jgi:hypothetical protein